MNYLESCIQDLQAAKSSTKSALLLDSLRDQPLDPNGRTALHLASSSDQFIESATTLLIDFKFNPNSRDGLGNVPLHYAVINRSEKIIKLLLKNCASVSVFNNDMLTPLFLAIFWNCVVIAKLMLKKGKDFDKKVDPFNRNALHVSVYMNDFELVEFILKEKRIKDINETDADGNTALHIAVFKNSKEMVHLLLLHRANPNVFSAKTLTPLSFAVHLGYDEIVELLVEHGADPNFAGDQKCTPLMVAVTRPFNSTIHFKILNSLLKLDLLDPNVPDLDGRTAFHHVISCQPDESGITDLLLNNAKINLNARDAYGVTPLHWAAFYNQKQTVQRLIEKNVSSVDTEDNRSGTPLEYAVAVNAVEIVKLLVSAGAQVERKGWKQRTPLHIAAGYGAREAAEFLIANKAKKSAADVLGLTPMHYASYHNFQDLISLLRPRGPLPKSKELTPQQLALIPHLISFVSFKVDKFHIPQKLNISIRQKATIAGIRSVPNLPERSKQGHEKVAETPETDAGEFIKPEIDKPYQQKVQAIYELFSK